MLDFLRHAESEFNRDPTIKTFDCGLSMAGKAQASLLGGDYDLVICSPLARAKRTLQLSKIVSPRVEFLDLAREVRTDPCDFLSGEVLRLETQDELTARVKKLRAVLETKIECHKRVLLLSHADLIWELTAEAFPSQEDPCGRKSDNPELIKNELAPPEKFGSWLKPGEFLRDV